MLVFYPYLFDSKEAWEKTISDANWRYDMPMSEFMVIYDRYKNKAEYTQYQPTTFSITEYKLPKLTQPPKNSKELSQNCSEILTQTEIDELLKTFL